MIGVCVCGGGGGRLAPPPSLIPQKCVICTDERSQVLSQMVKELFGERSYPGSYKEIFFKPFFVTLHRDFLQTHGNYYLSPFDEILAGSRFDHVVQTKRMATERHRMKKKFYHL